jgi:hypothetical protein
VVERHFRDLAQRYGSVLALDLINQVSAFLISVVDDVRWLDSFFELD